MDQPAMPTHVAIAVVEHQGRYLIGQRPSGLPLPGLWEFPGGKIEPGEAPEAAALRECREEAGLDVVVTGTYPTVEHLYDHGRLRLSFFACRPVDFKQQPKPPFRWVAAARLADYKFPPANATLLEYLKSL